MFNTIQAVMRGLRPGQAQTVGNMTVIPLLSDITDDTIASPEVLELETRDYGTIVAFNTGTDSESGLTFSPLGNVVLTSRAAQNHVAPSIRIVKKGKKTVIKNAACVQETQGGLVQKGRYRIMLLPLALREDAINTRKVRSYDKLWDAIRVFNKSLGLNSIGHLEYFLTRFQKEMDEFIAQFEIVPQQVGAIILIDGAVVGIERFPNYHFFKKMWEPLIRECYGSESIRVAREKGLRIPAGRIPLETRGVKSLPDIRASLLKAKVAEEKKIKRIVNGFIKAKFDVEVEEKTGGFTVETLSNPEFKGQSVRKKEIPLMFSFVKTGDWMADPNHARFAASDEFRM